MDRTFSIVRDMSFAQRPPTVRPARGKAPFDVPDGIESDAMRLAAGQNDERLVTAAENYVHTRERVPAALSPRARPFNYENRRAPGNVREV